MVGQSLKYIVFSMLTLSIMTDVGIAEVTWEAFDLNELSIYHFKTVQCGGPPDACPNGDGQYPASTSRTPFVSPRLIIPKWPLQNPPQAGRRGRACSHPDVLSCRLEYVISPDFEIRLPPGDRFDLSKAVAFKASVDTGETDPGFGGPRNELLGAIERSGDWLIGGGNDRYYRLKVYVPET